jgi:hypothetical protein
MLMSCFLQYRKENENLNGDTASLIKNLTLLSAKNL